MKPDRNLLYLLAGLLFVSLMLVFIPAWSMLWKLSASVVLILGLFDLYRLWQQSLPGVQRVLRSSVPVGVWSKIELHLSNDSNQDMRLTLHDHHPVNFDCQGLPREVFLPAQRQLKLSYRIRPQQRGDGVFPGIDLILHSSFSLWRYRRFIPVAERIRVFPNFREIAKYALLATDNTLSQMGIRRRQRRGEGSDFNQLREYCVGDSLRQIDWKASSRYRRLISKEYQDERDQQLVFLLDCGRHMRHQDATGAHLDHALNAMLLLSHVAVSQGDAVGFFTFGGQERWQPPRKDGDLIQRLLERTYDIQSTLQAADYLAAARKLMPLQRRRALLVILTNSRDEDRGDLSQAVSLLARRHLVVIAQLQEKGLSKTLEEPVVDFSGALRFHGVFDYLMSRREGFKLLQHQGGLLIDALPEQLPVMLVNRYLDIKASGML